jgi:hypothetical protein
MSISADIRLLARQGLSVTEIAQILGVRYQHPYNVLKRASAPLTKGTSGSNEFETSARALVAAKPPLTVEELVASGFELSCRWVLLDTSELKLDRSPPKASGVYAFAKKGAVLYVGVGTQGLAKRLSAYAKPGPSQSTNRRLNEKLRSELKSLPFIEIYTATPADVDWNGLPVSVSSGLEHGLITKYALPWNKQNAR